MMPPKLLFSLAFLLVMIGSAIAESELTLVESHHPKAVIVIADAPSAAATAGAKLMADFLFRMSGAKLVIQSCSWKGRGPTHRHIHPDRRERAG